MGLLIFPLLLLITITPTPAPDAAALADFNRFTKAVSDPIFIVDSQGIVREGVLVSATDSQLTMRFGSGETTFQRDSITAGERRRDSRKDGAIKGALFGAITGLFAAQGFSKPSDAFAGWLGSVAVYTSIGFALDAAQAHPEPIYRAAAQPAMKVSLRF